MASPLNPTSPEVRYPAGVVEIIGTVFVSDAPPAPHPRRAAASLGGGVVSRVEIIGTALTEYGHGGGCRSVEITGTPSTE